MTGSEKISSCPHPLPLAIGVIAYWSSSGRRTIRTGFLHRRNTFRDVLPNIASATAPCPRDPITPISQLVFSACRKIRSAGWPISTIKSSTIKAHAGIFSLYSSQNISMRSLMDWRTWASFLFLRSSQRSFPSFFLTFRWLSYNWRVVCKSIFN